jgi:SAM-dependent methyltransferase
VFLVVVVGTFLLAPSIAQVKEYDFYPEFRKWWFALPAEQRRPLDKVVDLYRQRLAGERVADEEIARRTTLIRTKTQDLERDFWNRYFTVDKPAFNTAPNSFLVSVVDRRRPGRALDVGMGEGRNSLYLAKLGWDVTGFDPADRAVALARQRATLLGLKLRAEVFVDREFDFRKEHWDLILLSWIPPNESSRIIQALRPSGIVIFEGPRFWFERNRLLKLFDGLRILRYEDEITKGDYFQDGEMPVVRLVAEKPAE